MGYEPNVNGHSTMGRPEYIRADLVYFARCEGFVKVGFTRTPTARVGILNTASPWPVRLLGLFVGGKAEEEAVHIALRLEGLHHRNEWFRHEGLAIELAAMLTESPCLVYEAREAFNQFWIDRFGSDALARTYQGRPGVSPQDAMTGRDRRLRFMSRHTLAVESAAPQPPSIVESGRRG